jgi:hypothetical protein
MKMIAVFERKGKTLRLASVQPSNRLPKGITDRTARGAYEDGKLVYARCEEVKARVGASFHITWTVGSKIKMEA